MARTLRTRKTVQEPVKDDQVLATVVKPPTACKRKRGTDAEVEVIVAVKDEEIPVKDKPPVTKKSRETKVKASPTSLEPTDVASDVKAATPGKAVTPKKARAKAVPAKQSKSPKAAPKPKNDQTEAEVSPDTPKPKRKSKKDKEAEAMPLAARTIGHRLIIGAHVSSAGGVHNAVLNSVHIGANAFALFLKSQRKWANPPLVDEHQLSFDSNCKSHSYDPATAVVPHGSYLVNLAHTDPTRTTQAYDSFLDDLQRCERLGIKLYNFHPGNVENEPKETPHATRRAAAISHLAANLNRAHAATSSVITLLENMAAKGSNTLGSTPEDLAAIIAQVTDKSRVGFCLDTCHAFASGLDMRSPAAVASTLQRLDDVVGLRYLRALHLNDSKAPFESCRDLHANIGTGFVGLRGFHALMNDDRVRGLPMVLETPIEVRDDEGDVVKDDKGKVKEDKGIWATEIKLLESLVGMDVESREFLDLEAMLAKKGRKERERVQDQVDRRDEKKVEKANKEAKKADKADKAKSGVQRKKKDDTDDESELSDA